MKPFQGLIVAWGLISPRVRCATLGWGVKPLRGKGKKKLAPLVREIGWTHNIVIVEKCKDDLQRTASRTGADRKIIGRDIDVMRDDANDAQARVLVERIAGNVSKIVEGGDP